MPCAAATETLSSMTKPQRERRGRQRGQKPTQSFALYAKLCVWDIPFEIRKSSFCPPPLFLEFHFFKLPIIAELRTIFVADDGSFLRQGLAV